jgi:hypothetical protein
MTTRFAISQVQIVATTGTDDFTNTDLGSENGKGAIWVGSWADGVDTGANPGACLSMGFSTVTAEVANQVNAADAVGAADSNRRQSVTTCLNLDTPGTETNSTNLAINSAITNGLRVDATKGTARRQYISAGLFNGDGVQIAVGHIDSATTAQNSTFSTTAPGFQPDLVIFMANGSVGSQSQTAGLWSYGAYDGTNSYCASGNINNTTDPTEHDVMLRSDRVAQGLLSSGNVSQGWEGASLDPTGFTLTQRDSVASGTTIPYIAIKSTDWLFKVGSYNVPTSGNVTVSGLGFTPEFLLEFISQQSTALGTNDTGADAGAFGIAMFDGTVENSYAISSEDNVATTNTESFATSNDTTIMDDAGNQTGGEAILGTTSFAAGQFTKTLTQWPAAIKRAIYIAGGPVSTTNTTILVPRGPLR